MAQRSAIILHLLRQSRSAVPACHPKSLINKAAERVGVFETELSPCIKVFKQQQRYSGDTAQLPCEWQQQGTEQHSPTTAVHSMTSI